MQYSSNKGFVSILFGLYCIASTPAFAADNSSPPSLPVEAENIYSISVKPNSVDGATSYKLRIFDDPKESHVVASAVRPMSGSIVNVEIYDVDDDEQNELVIMMAETVSASTKMHFDVFEFDGKKLEWIENFKPVSKLFELYKNLTLAD